MGAGKMHLITLVSRYLGQIQVKVCFCKIGEDHTKEVD